jgi:hypothetical protein
MWLTCDLVAMLSGVVEIAAYLARWILLVSALEALICPSKRPR